MKTAIIAGAGQMGSSIAELLNTNEINLIGFADNDKNKWNNADLPVMPVETAIELDPDMIIIAVLGESRSSKLSEQITRNGYSKEVILLKDLYNNFDTRGNALRRISQRLDELSVPGSAAELGVYKGDFAWQINMLMPKRPLYLFDTFEGFDPRDVKIEKESSYSHAESADFADTSVAEIKKRLPHSEQAEIKKGYFPETTCGMKSERFAFVSIDADLYAPTLAGLDFFYPRMNPGGIILIHDYNNLQFRGVKKAVKEYEERCGFLPILPVSDLHGSCAVIHP